MRNAICLVLLLMTVPGCVSGGNLFPADKAIINDLDVRTPLDSGYRVTLVDGKPAERARSAIVSVIPYVLVEAGEHTLELESQIDESLPAAKVTSTFEAGNQYRLKREGDVLAVVKDVE